MNTAMKIEEKFPQLSESNQQLISTMALKIAEQPDGQLNGGASAFFREIEQSNKASFATISRIYYTYVKNLTYDEISELANTYDEMQISNSKNVDKRTDGVQVKKAFYQNHIINVYVDNGKHYLIFDDLVKVLPISHKNTPIKNAFDVRARKQIEVNGTKVQAMGAEKAIDFIKNFLTKLPEGKQKVEIRYLLDSIYELAKDEFPAKIWNTKPAQIIKVPKVDAVKEAKKKNIQTKDVQTKLTKTLEKHVISTNPISTSSAKVVENKTSTLDINESEELKTLIKILNQSVGYLSPQAKEKLIEITNCKGLVHTTLAVTKLVSDIQKDTSLYFMNILEEKAKECL